MYVYIPYIVLRYYDTTTAMCGIHLFGIQVRLNFKKLPLCEPQAEMFSWLCFVEVVYFYRCFCSARNLMEFPPQISLLFGNSTGNTSFFWKKPNLHEIKGTKKYCISRYSSYQFITDSHPVLLVRKERRRRYVRQFRSFPSFLQAQLTCTTVFNVLKEMQPSSALTAYLHFAILLCKMSKQPL